MTKNGSKDFSDFWCDVSRDDSLSFYANYMSRKILVLKLWPKKLSANQIARLLFQTLKKNNFKEFSEFLPDDSGDDSLPPHTNCSSRKILVLELWPKKLPTNQIAWLLFQTLTKNNCKEFSEFLHDDSGDDSLPSHTNCMSSKILVLELWLKKLSANQIARLVFLTLAKNDCKEFSEFLHDDSRDDSLPSHTNCMSRKILVPELWPKKFSSNQVARLLFQTLTKNDFKKFSEFLHNDSRDDSLPSCTNCIPRKILADEIRGTFQYNK